MDVIQVHDMLNINEDKKLLNLLKNEKVYYSDVITKINHYGLSQERSIILTNTSLYNIKKKNLKRKIPYKEILGITFSNISTETISFLSPTSFNYPIYVWQNKSIYFSNLNY